MSEKPRLFWINPLAHHVYTGWLFLFHKYYDLQVYDSTVNVTYPFLRQNILRHVRAYPLGRGNFFNLYRNNIPVKDDDIVIVGDIFTNSLCFFLRSKKTIYYSEFFLKAGDGFVKTILFYIFTVFWRNKKILVPTLKAKQTLEKISKKVFYLPQIYFWEISDNPSLSSTTTKILFVWALDDWKKNVRFMMESLVCMKDDTIEIGLVGSNSYYSERSGDYHNQIDIRKYEEIFGSKFCYHGSVSHEALGDMYRQYNIFVLPSLVDPIGAVVLEAMAHSLPVLVSDNVGAADYICNGINGYVFRSNDRDDFLDKVRLLMDPKLRIQFWTKSKMLIESSQYYANEESMSEYQKKFWSFVIS